MTSWVIHDPSRGRGSRPQRKKDMTWPSTKDCDFDNTKLDLEDASDEKICTTPKTKRVRYESPTRRACTALCAAGTYDQPFSSYRVTKTHTIYQVAGPKVSPSATVFRIAAFVASCAHIHVSTFPFHTPHLNPSQQYWESTYQCLKDTRVTPPIWNRHIWESDREENDDRGDYQAGIESSGSEVIIGVPPAVVFVADVFIEN